MDKGTDPAGAVAGLNSAVELSQGELWSHLWISLQRLLWGLLAGITAGGDIGRRVGLEPHLE